MPLIDTHIHLTSPRYTDLPGLVGHAQHADVAGVVAAAVDESASYQILSMCDAFPRRPWRTWGTPSPMR